MATDIKIFELAVLRAAVEQKPLGTYFGSTAALAHWVERTQRAGLIGAEKEPTELGATVAEKIDLVNAGNGRSYMWPCTAELERAANRAAAEVVAN